MSDPSGSSVPSGDSGRRPEAGGSTHWDEDPAAYEEVVLVDLLDRLLDKGVVIAGDITLSVADVDLVYLGLRVLLSSAHTAERMGVALPSSAALHKTGLGSEPTGATSLEHDALGASATESSAPDSSALDSSALEGDATGDDALGSDLGFPHSRR